jgi:tetratricopeptide (TPR) repeat protein
LASWSDGRAFDQQLGDAHMNLFTTLGKLDIGAAVKLARLYLHFGFGVEAKQVLNFDPKLHQRWPELSGIANILDSQALRQATYFTTKNDCRGAVLLWKFVANQDGEPLSSDTNKAILFELSALPIHLRNILAPKVSARFLQVGSPKHAQSAVQTLERTEYEISEQGNFENANILLATNNPDEALKVFSKINSNTRVAAEALLQTTQQQLEANLETSRPTQELIEGYATEYQGTPLGRNLRNVAILSTSKAGRFSQVFAEISMLDANDQPPLLRQVYSDIVNFSEDAVFARHSFLSVDKMHFAGSKKLRLQFAERLLQLGFTEEAMKYLPSPSGAGDVSSEETSFLRAKILIAQSRPAAAIILLEKMDNDEAKFLLAQAFSMQGNRKKAHVIYQELNSEEQELLNAWLSTDWQDKFEGKDSNLGKLAQLAQSPVVPIALTDGMLGQVEELLAESRHSRDVITKVITDPELGRQ